MTRRDTTPRRVEADRSVWTALPRGEKVGAIAPHYAKGRSAAEIAGLLSEAYGCRISRGAIVGVISRNRRALDAALAKGRGDPLAGKINGSISGSDSLKLDRGCFNAPHGPHRDRGSVPHGQSVRGGVPGSSAPLDPSVPVVSSGHSAPLDPSRSDLRSSAPLDASQSALCASSPLDPSDSVAAQPQPARPQTATEGSAPHTDPVRGGVPFEDLGAGMCRFPLWGDGPTPPLAEMRFCGELVQNPKRSWCADHLAVVAGKEDPARADTRKRNKAIRRAFAQGVSVAALAARHDLPHPTIEGILQARAPAAIVGGLGVAFGTLKP